jgi:hypothetical protein
MVALPFEKNLLSDSHPIPKKLTVGFAVRYFTKMPIAAADAQHMLLNI